MICAAYQPHRAIVLFKEGLQPIVEAAMAQDGVVHAHHLSTLPAAAAAAQVKVAARAATGAAGETVGAGPQHPTAAAAVDAGQHGVQECR
jgi:hypothetical protein